MKVKITGNRGFLGQYLSKFYEGSIDIFNPDIVIHLACKSNVGYCNENRDFSLKNNIGAFIEEVEWCILNKVKGMVVASSDKVYGECMFRTGAIETDALNGLGIYESSKVAVDVIARSYSSLIPIVVTRCANFVGPDFHTSRLIPQLKDSINNNKPFVMRSDGSSVRDWLDIRDAVTCYDMLARELLDNPSRINRNAFNFSMERPTTIKEFIGLVENVTSKKIEVELGSSIPEIKSLSLCCEKARAFLGWKPAYTLEDSIKFAFNV